MYLMKKIMKYFFSVPFKTDFFHWFLRIDRIKIYQFSIQVIGNAAKLLPLKNRCTDFLWNFYFTGYSFPFFQKDFFFPVICGYTAFTSQIDFRSYILTIFHTVCYQDFSGLWFFPVGFVLIVVISEVQQFLCVTPFIGFVVGPPTAKETDDKCFALFFPCTYITKRSRCSGSSGCFPLY